jgi:MYXO-CTERM domain-containing protein
VPATPPRSGGPTGRVLAGLAAAVAVVLVWRWRRR